jgi:hypothetical protein
MRRATALPKLIIPTLIILVYCFTLYSTVTAPNEDLGQVLNLAPAPAEEQVVTDSLSSTIPQPPIPPGVISEGDLAAAERVPADLQVLGVESGGETRAYAMNDLIEGCKVIHDELGKSRIVIFLQAGTPYAAAFQATFDERILAFGCDGEHFVDHGGSTWNIQGQAIDGSLAGAQLEAVTCQVTLWKQWLADHPQTSLYTP